MDYSDDFDFFSKANLLINYQEPGAQTQTTVMARHCTENKIMKAFS